MATERQIQTIIAKLQKKLDTLPPKDRKEIVTLLNQLGGAYASIAGRLGGEGPGWVNVSGWVNKPPVRRGATRTAKKAAKKSK